MLHLSHVGVLVRPRAHDGLGLLARHALLPGFRAKKIYYFPHKYGKYYKQFEFSSFSYSLFLLSTSSLRAESVGGSSFDFVFLKVIIFN